MQEFESISASSYDPSALATKLTAKAGEGWAVVAIVPTGGDVTAFLSRDKADDAESSKAPDESKASVDTKPDTKGDTKGDTETKAAETIEAVTEKADDEPASLVLPAKSDTGADSKTESESKNEPVSEPSGWAIAPEPATPSSTPGTSGPAGMSGTGGTSGTAEPTGVQPSINIQPATTYEPSATPGYQPAPAPTPASATTPAAATPAAATPAAATPEPAAAPAVPAGWYADPAGRFELRYWDGSTWTEHVSRSGQQFTDPPVA